MSLRAFLVDRAHRAARHDRLRDPGAFLQPLRGGLGLELGGPSALFRSGGELPAYAALRSVDGVQVADESLFHDRLTGESYALGEPGKEGRLWITEASALGHIASETYDAVLSSHVLEHLANPLGALREWLRVLRPAGHLLLVLPHRDGTFDHRRPLTTLAHLVEDEENARAEDDMTHADEVIALHDLRRDPFGADAAELARRTRDNAENRMMHHHVFATRSAVTMLAHVGVQVRAVEARWPHDIYLLAEKPAAEAGRIDNSRWLAPQAPWVASSPFRSDRSSV